MTKDLLRLLRPHQYTKNLVVFLPAFFAATLDDPQVLSSAALAFLAFSLTASAVYILNDLADRESDRLHPEKRERPLAAGRINPTVACALAGVLILAGAMLMFLLGREAFAFLLAYLVLSGAYTLKLKHIAIVDVTIISLGFVLRLFIGGTVTGVALSHWIIVVAFLLALFLALAKRRDDVLHYQRTNQKTREAIDGYSLRFVDSAMMMCASITIVSYILWSISPEVMERLESENLYQTSLFVVLGVLRYLQITLVELDSGNPSRVLLRDRVLQLVVVCWLASFVWLFYLA